MLQTDGEPAWQGKTYNALKDKKHLTGINKEGSVIRLDVNARSGGVKQHEKKVLGGWGATLGGRTGRAVFS